MGGLHRTRCKAKVVPGAIIWHFGLVTYAFSPSRIGVSGSITLKPNPNVAKFVMPELVVRVRSRHTSEMLANVSVHGAVVVSMFANNETVVFHPFVATFTFNVTFASKEFFV